MSTTLATISIRQPHAWAVMAGIKSAEFRSRPCRYRGPLLVHAGKSEQHLSALDAYIADRADLASPTLYFGCLIGVADLVDCRLIRPGEFALILANPRPFEPVQAKGSLAVPYATDVVALASRFPDLAWVAALSAGR